MPFFNQIAQANARRQYWAMFRAVIGGLLASGMAPGEAIKVASSETRAALLKGAEDLKNAGL